MRSSGPVTDHVYRCCVCGDLLTLTHGDDSLNMGIYYHQSTGAYWNPAPEMHHVQIDLMAPDGQLRMVADG